MVDKDGEISTRSNAEIARVKASPAPKPSAKVKRPLRFNFSRRGCLVRNR